VISGDAMIFGFLAVVIVWTAIEAIQRKRGERARNASNAADANAGNGADGKAVRDSSQPGEG
jgi:hypothetical protein